MWCSRTRLELAILITLIWKHILRAYIKNRLLAARSFRSFFPPCLCFSFVHSILTGIYVVFKEFFFSVGYSKNCLKHLLWTFQTMFQVSFYSPIVFSLKKRIIGGYKWKKLKWTPGSLAFIPDVCLRGIINLVLINFFETQYTSREISR